MSKDRVRLTLARQVWSAGNKAAVERALFRTFGGVGLATIKRRWLTREYVRVECRPSQFARFLIYRDEEGAKNGFKDLHADIVPEEKDPYKRIAEGSGVDVYVVRRVLSELDISYSEIKERLAAPDTGPVVDLSGIHASQTPYARSAVREALDGWSADGFNIRENRVEMSWRSALDKARAWGDRREDGLTPTGVATDIEIEDAGLDGVNFTGREET
jgi:hypothetical protein